MLSIEQLSFWERKTYLEEIDFLIVGAGIVGCSTAIHLRKKYVDAKILVIERGYLPSGASSKNAGFTCFGSPTELYSDLKTMNPTTVWETVNDRWEGLMALNDFVGFETIDYQNNGSWDLITPAEKMIEKEIIDFLPDLNSEIEKITKHHDVYSQDTTTKERFGFNNVLNSFHNKLEGQIDTGKLLIRLHSKLSQHNILYLSGIELLEIHNKGRLLETSIGPITTKNCILTVNGFAKKYISKDVHPARAQVLVTSEIVDLKVKGTFHYQEGYYYFRNFGNRILIGGGRNLDIKGETTEKLETTVPIKESINQLLSDVVLPNSKFQIDYEWAGIMGVGKEKKPIIERVDDSLAVGVRLGGMGVAIGTIVGKKLSELF